MNAVKLLFMFDILMASVTPLLGKWKALSEKKKTKTIMRQMQLNRFRFDIPAKQCIFSKTLMPSSGEDLTNGTVIQMSTIHAPNFLFTHAWHF